MPRQPLPRQTVRPPTEAGAVPVADYPRVSQWEGKAIEELAETLSAIGGSFADLAIRSQELAITNEAADAIQKDKDAIAQYGLELKTNKEIRPLQYGDMMVKKMDELSKNWKFSVPATRTKYDKWWKPERSKLGVELTLEGMQEEARRYRASLNSIIAGFAESGDFESIARHLADGVEARHINPHDVPLFMKNAQFVYVDKKAMQLVRTHGEEAAIDFINKQTEILDAGEQSDLITKMKGIAKNLDADFDRASEQAQRQAIQTLFGKVADIRPQLGDDELDVQMQSFISMEERRAWSAIRNGMSKVTSKTETNYKKAIELEMKILDYWAGQEKSEGDKRSILTELATARYVDRDLADGYWQRINEWLQLEIPKQNVENLRASFKELERSYTGLLFTTGGQAKKVAIARGALVRWYVDERLARKKETTEEDFIIKARRLAAMFLEPETEESGKPTSAEEFENTVARLKGQDMDAARTYYDKWVGEWQ